jgi:proline iminopeptidase
MAAAQHWPGSELILVDEAGHDSGHPGMAESIVAATERFAAGRPFNAPIPMGPVSK